MKGPHVELRAAHDELTIDSNKALLRQLSSTFGCFVYKCIPDTSSIPYFVRVRDCTPELMRVLSVQRCTKQLLGASWPSSRLASSSSDAKALSQITGRQPPTPPDSTTTVAGQAFPGDLRSTSGLGFGDNLLDHTSKWMQVSPQVFTMHFAGMLPP